jgi:hypothetical protein
MLTAPKAANSLASPVGQHRDSGEATASPWQAGFVSRAAFEVNDAEAKGKGARVAEQQR